MTGAMALEILGVVTGIIYLWLEYRASIYLWIAGIIMPAIYIFVYYEAGLYADFGINIYYLVIAVYGWLSWKSGVHITGRRGRDKGEQPITHAPRRAWAKAATAFVVAQLLLTWILTTYTDSTVPVSDAFTTALSIVGMWLLARKYIEQWWVWCIVDIAYIALYTYKELYFTAVLYAVYAIIAIFGYYKWKKLMQEATL